MSILPHTQREATEADATVEPRPSLATAHHRSMAPTSSVPRTRTSAAWVGICAAALAVVALIIFMMQNTGSVEVTFLWMHGNLPLALALLIAGVGVTTLALIVGTARITQLRRLFAGRAAKRHGGDVSGSVS
jgi:lipopolysaccharide assembly protein A